MTMIKKIFLWSFVSIALLVIGLVLFFPLESFVKKKINETFGSAVSFKTLKIGWTEIAADGIVVKSSDGGDFLKVERLIVEPSLFKLLWKTVQINNIEIDSPLLVLRRTKNGKFLIPELGKKPSDKKKDEKSSAGFNIIIKAFKLKDGNIVFIDDTKTFKIEVSELNIDMKSAFSLFGAGDSAITASAKLPSEGKIYMNANGNIMSKDMKGKASLNNIDIALFKAYVDAVNIKKGRLNFDTNYTVEKGYVKAPSVARIKDIEVQSKGAIFGVPTPVVINLLKNKGEMDVAFNIWGPYNKLQNDLKESLQKKVVSGAGSSITKPAERAVEGVVKDLKNILPMKK